MEIICDCCGQQMKLSKKFETKQRGRKKSKYRIRRFQCELCEVEKTVFAGGWRDEKGVEISADEEIKKLYKQQEENQK